LVTCSFCISSNSGATSLQGRITLQEGKRGGHAGYGSKKWATLKSTWKARLPDWLRKCQIPNHWEFSAD
jgi:hypothetical protein